jgi:histidyl-tRNA synthetase
MKPTIPKGTRDFSPTEMQRRKYIFSTIERHFKRFGFLPIETPAMENLETLTGKYGEEGDRLIFKILNSGDYLKKADLMALEQINSKRLTPSISEKALRYDLTVPFARYVVQHQNEIQFPFKRYQMQAVWRADRPQKGRYREFFQCDADVVGSDSLRYDVEMVNLIDEVMTDLELNDFSIRINNRKLLAGLAEIMGISDRLTEYTVAIDKLDKIGEEGVINELIKRNMPDEVISKTKELFILKSDQNPFELLNKWFENSEIGRKGLEEIRYVFNHVNRSDLRKAKIEFDLTLARGLDYYTGSIFEVVTNETPMGSICGGGRYDDLTGVFGLKDVSGIGISFGADRLYDVLLTLDRFPDFTDEGTQLLFVNFGEVEADYCEGLVTQCRRAGINTELYPNTIKMQKQMKYANAKEIPWVAMVGEDEVKSGLIRVKNMETGDQHDVSLIDLILTINK